MQRLQGHAGSVFQVVPERWPSLLPQAPAAAFRITPAGLLEWCGPGDTVTPSLRVVIDASNPLALAMQLVSGKAPPAHVEGDSRLAGDVDWLIANLRWDLVDDLESTFGPVVAQALASLGQSVRAALETARKGAADLASRFGRPSP